MEKKITNMAALTADLAQNYEDLKARRLPIKEAKELANVAGKIIGSCKVQLDYNAYMKIKKPIPFLQPDKKKK